MAGMTDLETMLSNLVVEVRPDRYVYVQIPTGTPIPDKSAAMIEEAEGTTIILTRGQAEELRLDYTFIASWITLTIHSSLQAVGLTAAFSQALAARGISCNVLAGYLHDHILVPAADTEKAVRVLKSLAE